MPDANSLYGPLDPAPDAGWVEAPPRMGFFTDTSVCIGCKACEVACKEWNGVPDSGFDLLGMSYDNTGALTANSWRHVAFIEQPRPAGHRTPAFAGDPTGPATSPASAAVGAGTAPDTGTNPGLPPGRPEAAARMAAGPEFLGMPGAQPPGRDSGAETRTDFRWLMMSDVCKHCTHAACLDVCPTGSLFRTEFGTVVVQEDICNGCGYCISACPYGVIDQRKGDGRAWKCTLCYDRIGAGMTPACAQACPTESIQYGPLDELRERAATRVAALHERGVPEARLYGHDPTDGVGGDGAFFLLLDEPEVYGLPPDPVVTTRDLPKMWKRAGFAALAMAAAAVAAFVGGSS
ncbi:MULTISPECIES: 4Fe-4S dicluster domain-containing protein [Micromonospora]|uniref:4Fe-4S dicluster domain-containing protein n=1 Tax=Micromonospora chalcea TaxID=1874 RepID=A0ABX9XYZ4_MICCH|nr:MULTISPECIES: 4Fe-4S dicluster domain-containing protein [Micromonospora]MBP1783518.1 formate dehydrogenase iron-sulfur subunit [Micromonospora sp. HB375]MDH6469167.1 formate dehydrogenase iron-sulfur subunit [Micromonospora sp. H404/HB375]ODB73670.1 4Fe-4S ferredoxin [Micromonospora sp. II]RQW89242.1 4Fe-4S dicluster domain-containing protein [Micromonospora chalcea]